MMVMLGDRVDKGGLGDFSWGRCNVRIEGEIAREKGS